MGKIGAQSSPIMSKSTPGLRQVRKKIVHGNLVYAKRGMRVTGFYKVRTIAERSF